MSYLDPQAASARSHATLPGNRSPSEDDDNVYESCSAGNIAVHYSKPASRETQGHPIQKSQQADSFPPPPQSLSSPQKSLRKTTLPKTQQPNPSAHQQQSQKKSQRSASQPSVDVAKSNQRSSSTNNSTCTTTTTKRMNKFLIGLVVTVIVALAFAVTGFVIQIAQGFKETIAEKAVPISCMDVLRSGRNETGVYTITAGSSSKPSQVYCDMESGGGGWTLVASVHENNIHAKCSVGDKWSSETPVTSANVLGSNNWENNSVFGAIAGMLGSDYKASAYFELNASDVMIWHVPNTAKLNKIQHQAFLKYYTNNRFLNSYGSNLQSLFAHHLPFEEATLYSDNVASAVLSMIDANQANITSNIPNWNQYPYAAGTSSNYMTSSFMFNHGNQVNYEVRGVNDYASITYGNNYTSSIGDYFVTSAAIHPFTMLAWIENSFKSVSTFGIKVVSTYLFVGEAETHQGSFTAGNFKVQYRALHNRNTASLSYHSSCEVYFSIENNKVWASNEPILTATWTGTAQKQNVVEFSNLKRVLVGYTLLSRDRNYEFGYISQAQIEAVLRSFVDQAGKIRNKPLERGLSVPVEFVKGSPSDVTSRVPRLRRDDVTPGFIHFRPVHSPIESLALCPGMRVQTDTAAYSSCIGARSVRSKYCGDFSGWEGEPRNSSTNSLPTWTGRSKDEIHSSILIFIRNVNETYAQP